MLACSFGENVRFIEAIERSVFTPRFANALALSSPLTIQVMVEDFSEACFDDKIAARIEPPLCFQRQ
jgi:hypothetical protein